MITTQEVKKLYASLQKQLFYLIPEKWDSVYLYASVIEQILKLETGELFFYYYPKGILKKKPINVYEIPEKFSLNEEEYIKLVEKLYNTIKELREIYKKEGERVWSNITIKLANFKFEIEYDYEDLTYSKYSNIERHIIWKYENLKLPIESFNKKERKLILEYLDEFVLDINQKERYVEPLYKQHVKNVIEYNKEDIQDVYVEDSEMKKLEKENKQRLEEQKYTYITKEKKSIIRMHQKQKEEKQQSYIEQIEQQRQAVKSQILNQQYKKI